MKKIEIKNNSELYQGDVSITVFNNGIPYKKIRQHNAGTADFFEYILNCIRGTDVSKSIPAYIYACSDTEGAVPVTNFGTLTEGTPELTVNYSTTNPSASLKYIFLIPGVVIPSDKNVINSFALKDLQNKKIYATVSLDESLEINNADINTNILVEWNLSIFNSTSQMQLE